MTLISTWRKLSIRTFASTLRLHCMVDIWYFVKFIYIHAVFICFSFNIDNRCWKQMLLILHFYWTYDIVNWFHKMTFTLWLWNYVTREDIDSFFLEGRLPKIYAHHSFINIVLMKKTLYILYITVSPEKTECLCNMYIFQMYS